MSAGPRACSLRIRAVSKKHSQPESVENADVDASLPFSTRPGDGGRLRKLLAALAVALLTALAAPTESTARFYGVYDSFTYASTPKKRLFKTDHERFSAMRSAGLNTVLNYATFRMSIKENLRYAWAAQQHGIRVLWALHYYGSHGPGLKWKLRLVNRTKALPATLGYYVGDEVMFGTDEARRMEELTIRIENRTRKKTLYTAKPNPAEVTPFAGWTDWLAVDPYPVGYPAGAGGTAAEEVGAAMSWAGGAVRPSALAVALQLSRGRTTGGSRSMGSRPVGRRPRRSTRCGGPPRARRRRWSSGSASTT